MSKTETDKWYVDWQSRNHAASFDCRHTFDDRNLILDFESFNDVRLFNERVDTSSALDLLEVGCATGEFYRYLTLKHPSVNYYGIDVSHSAIERAKAKYPAGKFFTTNRESPIEAALTALGVPNAPEVVYTKDVVHHQTKPLEFVTELLGLTARAVIMRCRTRDVGPTQGDPELSCQYHYDGWMPYIVTNLQELIDHIIRVAPACEVVVYRNHVILGGRENRFLPKECYLRETGTAETTVGAFLQAKRPGTVVIRDRVDQNPVYTVDFSLRRLVRRALRIVR